MSCLYLKNHCVETPVTPISNSVELLVPVQVERSGVIVQSSEYRKKSVSDNTIGMNSKMFILENIIANGQQGNLKEVQFRNNNPEFVRDGVLAIENAIKSQQESVNSQNLANNETK